MKKLAVVLFVLLTGLSLNLFAQAEKGMMEFSLNGPLLLKSTEADITMLAPTAQIGYFTSNAFELGGTFGLLSYGRGSNSSDGFILGVNGQCHFSMQKKTWPFAGIGFTANLGEYFERFDKHPMQIEGRLGLKYWPMEGGAIVINGFFTRQFPEPFKENYWGIDLGVLIRIK